MLPAPLVNIIYPLKKMKVNVMYIESIAISHILCFDNDLIPSASDIS